MREIRNINIFTYFAALLFCLLFFNDIGAANNFTDKDSRIEHIEHLIALADSLVRAGNLGAAAEPADSAVFLAREAAGDPDTLLAKALNVRGKLSFYASEYEQCRKSWQEACDIRLRTLGRGDELTAASLNNLGALAKTVGEFARAESLYHDVLEIRLDIQGEDHPDLAGLYTNLGSLKRITGKFAEAESLYYKAYRIQESSSGLNHPLTAGCLNNIAVLYEEQGRYDKAEQYYLQAIRIRRETLGESHPQTASGLNNLANLYYNQGHYDSAETLYIQALAIRERVFGEKHLALTSIMNNLAILYMELDDYQRARELLSKSMEIKKAALPANHPLLASTYDNLGIMYYNLGSYDSSRIYLEKASTIYEQAYTDFHPYAISSRLNLAQLQAAIGHSDSALDEYIAVTRNRRKFIIDIFSYASEEHKLKYLDKYPLIEQKLIALALDLNSTRAITAVGEMLLGGKAVVIDAICAEKAAASRLPAVDPGSSLFKWRKINGEISTLVLAGAEYLESDMYRRKIDSLYAVKDSLETEISRKFGTANNEFSSARFNLNDISEALPDSSVLWEFVKFKDYDFRGIGAEKQRTGDSRYAAFVIDFNGSDTLIDLGKSEPIDSLINLLRQLLYDSNELIIALGEAGAEAQIKAVARKIYDLVFQPLLLNSGRITDILISPDGELNLLPFDILVTGKGEYVIENFRLSYLSSGRDLLASKPSSSMEGRVIIVADPDFDCPGPDREKSRLEDRSGFIDNDLSPQRGTETDFDCLARKFQRLPYTRIEAERVEIIMAGMNHEVQLYLSEDASEAVIKNLISKPAILHIASHGYFCREGKGIRADDYLQNPLLRSGLILAGANCVAGKDRDGTIKTAEDGILTAFEASGLDLEDTRLVTLSACETGIGQVESGEGIFGLRRAFQHAGARSILMSLWKVREAETCDLMEAFYRNWLKGYSKKNAVHEAALKVMYDHRLRYGGSHPYFWGGFVLFGDPE